MIAAPPKTSFDSVLARLAAKAATLAVAKAERDTLARRNDPSRWRRAALVWPLFGKG